MSEMKQNQHTGTPSTGRNPLEQGSDDQAEHLVAEAKRLQQQAADITKGALDPRRSMPIDVRSSDTRSLLYINGTLWAEVDWSPARNGFCIQDCLGYCLKHVEHIVKTIPLGKPGNSEGVAIGMKAAIEVAKQMIRDGSMRTPEEAQEFAIKNNTKARQYYGL